MVSKAQTISIVIVQSRSVRSEHSGELDGIASTHQGQRCFKGLQVSGLGGLKSRSLGLQAGQFLVAILNADQLGFALVRQAV